jgi:hypothetical protein
MATMLPQTNFALDQGDTLTLVLGPVLLTDPVTNVADAGRSDRRADADHADGEARGERGRPRQLPEDDRRGRRRQLAGDGREQLRDDHDRPGRHRRDLTGTLPQNLLYDVQLREPSGRKTTLARGTITVSPDITNA